ncbi:MAG: hypothetical protein ACRDRO_27325 [Pseudonocardiaceae bacterium]
MGTAMADPVPLPPPYPPVSIVGAQTTEDLFNTLCNNNTTFRTNPADPTTRLCQSWGVAPQPSNITTRPTGCVIARPKQGGDGTDRLISNPACVDVARVVTNDSATRPPGFTYIPMATDALTYAIRGDNSIVSPTLTDADLKAIYTCNPSYVFDKVTGRNPNGYQPLLGSFGAGNRTQLFKLLNITDAANYTDPGQPGECITDKDSNGVGLLANDGRVLTNKAQLITYSAAPWLAQVFKASPDIHGASILGSINGISPAILNDGSFGSRTVFNVVRSSDTASGNVHDLFVGTGSKVCSDSADIKRAGFNTLPGTSPAKTCGDTSIVSGN